MPYLQQKDKDRLLDHLYPETAGELNYALTTLVRRYLSKSTKNYEAYNAAIGALEACKLEFYRRMVSVYEDEKIKINGDVY